MVHSYIFTRRNNSKPKNIFILFCRRYSYSSMQATHSLKILIDIANCKCRKIPENL